MIRGWEDFALVANGYSPRSTLGRAVEFAACVSPANRGGDKLTTATTLPL